MVICDCYCFVLPLSRFELDSRQGKKDKVEGAIQLSIHLKVDKSKLPETTEIEKQYDLIMAAVS